MLFFVSLPAGAANLPNDTEPLIVRSQIGMMGLELTLANLEQERTTITLTSLDVGTRHFFDQVRKHNGYSWSFNLDDLPDGRYCLKVKKGDAVRQQVLRKEEGKVMCSEWK